MEVKITVDFKEAIFGTEKIIEFKHYAKCEKCGGSGVEPGSKFITCQTCGGSGQVMQAQSTFFGTFRTVATCPRCHGEGKIAEKKCSTCRGEGRQMKESKLNIKIPAGIDNGQSIKISGQGEAGKGGAAGDLYVTVFVKSDPEFKREGDDLYSEKEISISQAVLGGQVGVKTVDGEVLLKIPGGTSQGQEIRLRGLGVPRLNGRGPAFAKAMAGRRGDQIVKIKIKIPKNLSRKQKELLEKLKEEGL